MTNSSRNAAKLEGYRFAQTILDSISVHVAILDKDGLILETSRAWKQFAEKNQIRMRPDTLQVNYLEICDHASGEGVGESSQMATGIRDVIAGRIAEFIMGYPCQVGGLPRRGGWVIQT